MLTVRQRGVIGFNGSGFVHCEDKVGPHQSRETNDVEPNLLTLLHNANSGTLPISSSNGHNAKLCSLRFGIGASCNRFVSQTSFRM